MPRRMYDFECKDSHITESFVDVETKEVQCSVCDGTATRIISPTTIYLDPVSGLYPSATSKWHKMRAEKLALERKTKANHGS
jgi:ubiquitin C-terminal hydrolase